MCLEAGTSGPAECPQVQSIHGPFQRRVVDIGDGVGDCPFGSNGQARRCQQLGDIRSEKPVRCSHLAEAEVDQPDLVVLVEEDVRQA